MTQTLLRGARVRLVATSDPHTQLQPGELGTVTTVDGLGTVHVRWDSGSTLGMVPDAGDVFEVVEDGPHVMGTAAGPPHGGWSRGKPHGRWSAGPPDNGTKS